MDLPKAKMNTLNTFLTHKGIAYSRVRTSIRRRWRFERVLFIGCVLLLVVICYYQAIPNRIDVTLSDHHRGRSLLSTDITTENSLVNTTTENSLVNTTTENSLVNTTTEKNLTSASPIPEINVCGNKTINSTSPCGNKTKTSTSSTYYPPNIFKDDMLNKGAIVLFIIGILYMFMGLAIVCDEYFVPSLEVIIEKFGISEDVAGATFMAAGGSAPELFTSLIGTFVATSDVGIGTIVGSAVFNILFVIACCALFSKGILQLTWWPLFRDVSFYSISLIALIVCFLDNRIHWWESLILLCCYISYVSFMKFNPKVENWVKSCSCSKKSKVDSQELNEKADAVIDDKDIQKDDKDEHIKEVLEERRQRALTLPASPRLRALSIRPGVLQMMIQGGLKSYGVTQSDISLERNKWKKDYEAKPDDSNTNTSINSNRATRLLSLPFEPTLKKNSTDSIKPSTESGLAEIKNNRGYTVQVTGRRMSIIADNSKCVATSASKEEQTLDMIDELEDDNEPLDISWPDTCFQRFTYIIVAPLMFPLYFSMPDVRRDERRNGGWFVISFIGSIVWIAIYAFLMNWWAFEIGLAIGIPETVMGLTFLAAGTSIPDLITSVIVAKKGFGDMAVSSSIGSNIFDVTLGLPLPWILWAFINDMTTDEGYEVDSKGLFCSIMLLFVMLILMIVMIASFKWKMSKGMGAIMLLAYAVFVSLSLLLEFSIIHCPIT